MQTERTYLGVGIIKSCNHYYPVVNTNMEFKSLKQCKKWIRRTWRYVQKGINRLEKQSGLPKNSVLNILQSFA